MNISGNERHIEQFTFWKRIQRIQNLVLQKQPLLRRIFLERSRASLSARKKIRLRLFELREREGFRAGK